MKFRITLKDPDGVYLACNRRFEQFFGATEAQILGRTDARSAALAASVATPASTPSASTPTLSTRPMSAPIRNIERSESLSGKRSRLLSSFKKSNGRFARFARLDSPRPKSSMAIWMPCSRSLRPCMHAVCECSNLLIVLST